MDRNGRIHGVTHATGMNASDTGKGSAHDSLNVPAPAPHIRRSGSAVNPKPKKQPGASAPGTKHTTH